MPDFEKSYTLHTPETAHWVVGALIGSGTQKVTAAQILEHIFSSIELGPGRFAFPVQFTQPLRGLFRFMAVAA